ncbi:ABC transporter G family member 20 [Galendromus occidentalis]|uniref:ABC transporter G family member 20 n=1 Tax=Galendromus occidentalis TaxID=34638 RepID=A0AAJ7SG40_9ACAR|nr:ABC transporter G family member 20 [Galendromus occidentalis]
MAQLLDFNIFGQEDYKYPLGELSTSDRGSMSLTQKLAVDVDRLRLTYGYGNYALDVLKGIDLTVPEGKIYGLLGPSGCGKTTLLKCIVGRLKPQGGMVRVFDQIPGSPGSCIPGPGVGYMPQEPALYQEKTIYGNLHHFGQLYGMPEELIQERIRFLLDFLDLPRPYKKVGKLSGGQQRRVSLAVALIHEPPLLILDEPTVGVDPLLRLAIWNYLVTLTREKGMTVIVTTHYVEEARQAHMVGLMRSGRMLAQDSPDRLMEDFRCGSLEDVFLQLCIAADKEKLSVAQQKNLEVVGLKIEDKDLSAKELEGESEPNARNISFQTPSLCALPPDVARRIPSGGAQIDPDSRRRDTFWETSSRQRVPALVKKNITRLRSNYPFLLFTFLVPSFQVILFCLCIGADPYDLPVAVVNADANPRHSQAFLDTIPGRTIIQRPYSGLGSALASVERGETYGVIHIGPNYSKTLKYRFLSGIDADNVTLEESTIDIHMDMTNQQIGFILQKTIFESFVTFCEELLRDMNKNVALAQLPVRVKDPVYGNGKPSFTEFMAPGIILSITYIMAVALTSISIIMESREGTMERCWVAGVKPFEVVGSHVISQFCVMSVQVASLLFFIFAIFGIPLEGSFINVVFLTFTQGLTGMTYGLVISSVCSEEQSAMMLALGTFYPNLLLSGIIWPVQAMPSVVRYVAYGLPQTIPTEALRCIMYRGWGVDKYEVWLGFVVSIGWSTFFLLFATVASKARK